MFHFKGKLLRCMRCRLKWFPEGGSARNCPACGHTQVRRTIEAFHLGAILLLVAAGSWLMPSMKEGDLPAQPRETARPAFITAKRLTLDVEDGPNEGQRLTFRRGDRVTVLRLEGARVLVHDPKGNLFYVKKEHLGSK
jgi:hypothetical protein